ncbi:MAG: transglutaminase domain-containing protein [Gammaproteobacteria bacterium]|nr:transglutaminase domain-containing protein [Gammaproteobacteria bacterium]
MRAVLAENQPSDERLQRFSAAVDSLEQRLEQVRGALDQTRFDPGELVFDLAFDAHEIADYVANDIVFQPYEGLLRGAISTLQTRSGNSLDQSVLLAYLLKTAGYDARIVRGTLTGEQARALLATTAEASWESDFTALDEAVEDAFGDLSAMKPDAVSLEDSATADRARRAVRTLEDALTAAGVEFQPAQLDASVIESAQDYFWVQWKDGAGRDWQPLHPAYPGLTAEPEIEAYLAEEVPVELQHRVTFSAYLRRREGSDFEVVRLMDDWTRPAANLHGVTLTFSNAPVGIERDGWQELFTEPAANTILLPIFDGAPAPGAVGFDPRGRVIDAMVAGQGNQGATGLFSELSEGLDEAAGTVADPDSPESAFGLDAMWLEWTLESPGGERRTQRRYLLGPHAQRAADPQVGVLPLLTEYTYVVNVGAMSPELLADRLLQTASKSMPVLQAQGRRLVENSGSSALPEAPLPEDFSPLGLSALMERNPLAGRHEIAVRDTPGIVGVRSGLRDAQTGFVAVDVVFNDLLHLTRSGANLRHGPMAAMRRGVWETALEGVPATGRRLEETGRLSTLLVFDAAARQNIDLRVIEPATVDVSETLAPGVAERALLERDLADGYVVVVPERRPAGMAMTGWWRVDPVRGTTLGMLGDGHGSELFEYEYNLINTIMTFVGATLIVTTFSACDDVSGDLQQMCCLVEAHLDAAGGMAFGEVLGGALGGGVALTYSVVDFGVQQVSGRLFDEQQSITPDVVNLGCRELIADKEWL